MYFPFIYTLFIFILINNLIGMVKRCLLNLLIFIINILFFRTKSEKNTHSSTQGAYTPDHGYGRLNFISKLKLGKKKNFLYSSYSYIHTKVSKSEPRYSFN